MQMIAAFGKYFEDPVAFFTFLLAVFTAVLAFATFRLTSLTGKTVKDSRESLQYAQKSNERADRLFVGQNQPLIDVTPIAIRQVQISGDTQAVTTFSIANYSGFAAFNIALDLMYGNPGTWIGEWRKAKTDYETKEKDKGIELNKDYPSPPATLISELAAGDSTKSNAVVVSSGSLVLENICKSPSRSIPVSVRVAWSNEKGHVFDEVHKYTLLCTSDGKIGIAFTFIPEGIISKKATGIRS